MGLASSQARWKDMQRGEATPIRPPQNTNRKFYRWSERPETAKRRPKGGRTSRPTWRQRVRCASFVPLNNVEA